jgi:ankyrin repeat protein
MMHLLLQYGAHVNNGAFMCSMGSPLKSALSLERWAAAEWLLLRGAHTGSTTLIHAVQRNAPPRIIELLLQHGASDVNDRAMFTASKTGQHEVVRLLLFVGLSDTSKQHVRPIVTGRLQAAFCGAASQAQLQFMHSLLDSWDKIREPSCGLTAMLHAKMLSRALEAAVVGQTYSWELAGQEQPLYYIREAFTEAHKQTVSLLLQRGADPNYGAGKLLAIAVKYQHGALLQLLLDAGATATEPALQAAAGRADVESVVKLLSVARGGFDETGATLAIAACGGHATVVKMLLARGANVIAALEAVTAIEDVTAATLLLSQPRVRITDRDSALLKGLLDMAAKKRSFDLLWHTGVAADMWASATTSAQPPPSQQPHSNPE